MHYVFDLESFNSKETNPSILKWMSGFPPKQDKIISAMDGSFFRFPALRYSVNHMREFLPTRTVLASKDKKYKVKVKLDNKIDKLLFTPWNYQDEITIKDFLEKNYNDGFIILHKGKIIYEKYFAGLKPEGIHASMSISQSFLGLIALSLITEGLIDSHQLITHYIPELEKSGFADATVQELLDMTTAVQYSQEYTNPHADIWKFSEAGSHYKQHKSSKPQNYYEYLQSVKKKENLNHGEVFGYKTINSEVLGWLISRVTGKCITELISEKIWRPMGAHYDGYYQIDTAGKAFSGGGFNLNLRDMAFFGEMIRNKGKLNNKQILSPKVMSKIYSGGSTRAFSKSGEFPLLKGWSFHNMWWITNNENKAFMARGVHGQALYIDPTAQMVIAAFASNPLSSNKYIDPLALPAYKAIADYLINKI